MSITSNPQSIPVFVADIIHLGTGAGGAVFASVASEEQSVISCEAGPNRDNDPVIIAPSPTVMYSEGCNSAKYYWPGDTCATLTVNNRKFPWTNGRLRGGGSSINGEIYLEGSAERFQD